MSNRGSIGSRSSSRYLSNSLFIKDVCELPMAISNRLVIISSMSITWLELELSFSIDANDTSKSFSF
ncbi:hypothetical protein Hanom_Chr08g00734781 [Helianthus anomalus]